MAFLPELHVEGSDDISVISALLLRHGVDTKQGTAHLKIKQEYSVGAVIDLIPDTVRASSERPVGFVLDIDDRLQDRWNAVANKLRSLGIEPPNVCPTDGYIGQLRDYPHPFGVWLMPDCASGSGTLEHLVKTLVPAGDPLWPLAENSVNEAARIADEFNRTPNVVPWKRFREVDRRKSEIHTWLAWGERPGAPLGAAIQAKTLGSDSPQALAFLRWMKRLFGFADLAV